MRSKAATLWEVEFRIIKQGGEVVQVDRNHPEHGWQRLPEASREVRTLLEAINEDEKPNNGAPAAPVENPGLGDPRSVSRPSNPDRLADWWESNSGGVGWSGTL